MLLSLISLLFVVGIFALLGVLVLGATRWPGLRPWPLIIFVLSAIGGSLEFSNFYGPLVADLSSILPGSSTSIAIFFLGVGAVGAIVGWLGAAAATFIFKRVRR